MSKKNIIIAGSIVIALVLVGWTISQNKNAEILAPNPPPLSEEISLEGEYTCLPPRDTAGPQTLECALGMKADNGFYYAIDSGSNWSLVTDVQTGERIRIEGTLRPIEELDSGQWQKYNVEGIIRITSLTKI